MMELKFLWVDVAESKNPHSKFPNKVRLIPDMNISDSERRAFAEGEGRIKTENFGEWEITNRGIPVNDRDVNVMHHEYLGGVLSLDTEGRILSYLYIRVR